MSIWTNISGNVKIHKNHKVSIRKILEDTFTDEVLLADKATKEGEYYNHSIEANLSIDGDDFCKKYKEFINNLKADSVDITCTIRFFR
jgi:hypothetical protein